MSWLGAGKAAAAQGAAARLAQGEAHDSPQRHGRRLLQFVSRDEVEIVGDAADCGGHAQKFPGYRSKGNVDTFQHHARRGLSHHSATAPRPILKIRIQSSLLGSMSVAEHGGRVGRSRRRERAAAAGAALLQAAQLRRRLTTRRLRAVGLPARPRLRRAALSWPDAWRVRAAGGARSTARGSAEAAARERECARCLAAVLACPTLLMSRDRGDTGPRL